MAKTLRDVYLVVAVSKDSEHCMAGLGGVAGRAFSWTWSH